MEEVQRELAKLVSVQQVHPAEGLHYVGEVSQLHVFMHLNELVIHKFPEVHAPSLGLAEPVRDDGEVLGVQEAGHVIHNPLLKELPNFVCLLLVFFGGVGDEVD